MHCYFKFLYGSIDYHFDFFLDRNLFIDCHLCCSFLYSLSFSDDFTSSLRMQ